MTSQSYDIIGDIHGHGDELIALLRKLGYSAHGKGFSHPDRQVLFLGDLIDRGKQNDLVINTVRHMIDQGSAQCIMGNHEFNAISYHTRDESGDWLREHSPKNQHQHSAFLDEFLSSPKQLQEAIEFFRTLPVYLDLGDLRLVHACWHNESLKKLRMKTDEHARLTEAAYLEGHTPGSDTFEAIDILLKGHEFQLPPGVSFTDKDGFVRTKMRSKWWLNSPGSISEYSQMPQHIPEHHRSLPVPEEQIIGYKNHEPPLFIGHYWESGEPKTFSDNVACVDYSMGKGRPTGNLVAYRWKGEQQIAVNNYVGLWDWN